jgi:hypothetical protein
MDRKRSAAFSLVVGLAMVLTFSAIGAAQQVPQEGQQKPADEKAQPANGTQQSDLELRAAIKALVKEVQNLTGEVSKLRHAAEQNADAMQLLLYEDRLARTVDEISAATARKAELDSSELTLNYRKSNIQQELIWRGGLDREASEAAIRSEIERSLHDVHAQQAANEKRLMELQNEEPILRSRIQELRRKLNVDQAPNHEHR